MDEDVPLARTRGAKIPTAVKSFLREPLVHFLLAGAVLFGWYEWRGGGAGPGSTRIVLSSGQIESLAAGFARTWQRPASEAELKALIDDWVREEIAVREAMAMGLDRDDTVIRRRLRQKLEFLVEDFGAAAPPTDAELQAWFDAHAGQYRTETRIALRQVFLSRDRRGSAADRDARALLGRLAAAGADAPIGELGDPSLLPQEVELAPRSEIAGIFGGEFADGVEKAALGTWTGPVESGYGLHLVCVRERLEGGSPALAAVRPAVEREFLAERRTRQVAGMYEKLLARYTVVVVGRPERPAVAESSRP
jgi:hypothetical protein